MMQANETRWLTATGAWLIAETLILVIGYLVDPFVFGFAALGCTVISVAVLLVVGLVTLFAHWSRTSWRMATLLMGLGATAESAAALGVCRTIHWA